MLDKVWTCCSSVIPKVLLSRPMKPHRKSSEVISNECSLLEKDKKEILIMKCGIVLYRESFSDAFVELNFATSGMEKPRLWLLERGEPAWKDGESPRFAGFADVGEEEWALWLGCAGLPAHTHPHAAAVSNSQFCHRQCKQKGQSHFMAFSCWNLKSRHQLCSCQWCLIIKMSPWQTNSYSWNCCLVSPFECTKKYSSNHACMSTTEKCRHTYSI